MNEMTQVLGTVAMVPKGEYDSTTYYEKLNTVIYNGSTYVAKKNSMGVDPTDTNFWDLLAKAATDIVYDSFNESLYITLVGRTIYNEITEDLTFVTV